MKNQNLKLGMLLEISSQNLQYSPEKVLNFSVMKMEISTKIYWYSLEISVEKN